MQHNNTSVVSAEGVKYTQKRERMTNHKHNLAQRESNQQSNKLTLMRLISQVHFGQSHFILV